MPHQYTHIVSQKCGRSTTGCAACKIRKVKCDERRPACLRCQSRHLECPGYPTKVLKWSAKHEKHVIGKVQHTPNRDSRPGNAELITLPRTGSIATPEMPDDSTNTTPGLVDELVKPATFQVENIGPFRNIPVIVDSVEVAAAEIEEYSDGINHAFEVLTADLGLALANAPLPHDDMFSSTMSPTSENYSDFSRSIFDANAEGAHATNCSVDALPLSTDQIDFYNSEPSSVEAVILPSTSLTLQRKPSVTPRSLPPSLIHVPTLLVDYYFQKVCRDCSTFDSMANPFRSRISELQHTSAPLHYAIQSLAASKLANDMPRMKVVGIEAQGKALQNLKTAFSTVNTLHVISDDILFTLLLLGMTTSWHTREDLGLEYLHLARRIVAAKAQTAQTAPDSNLDFYQNAIRYWTMIASMVSGEIEYIDTPATDPFTKIGSPFLSVTEGIMPHPWAGVSPRSLQLFGLVLQLIRKTRGGHRGKTTSSYSKAGIVDIANAIATAERLEAECWSVSIPPVDHLKDTGDLSTPPLHHVLTAKAYLMSALLHLYMIFPDVLETRTQLATTSSTSSVSEDHLQIPDSAHIMSQSFLWSQRSSGDHRDAWLKDVGHRIVECLENVDWRSSTRVVHPPLLLSVASALTLRDEADITWCQNAEVSNIRIHQCRSFIVSRLETMQAAMRFHAIDNILKVIKEIWTRSDAGQQDIFWMDVMSELHCETIFG